MKLAPGIGGTVFGNLPRDLQTAAAHNVILASDFVTLHTAADATDPASADAVRRIGCPRVWLAVPGNYFSNMDLQRGRVAALAEATRVAKVATAMHAEALELNGEGASNGKKVGDWTSEVHDVGEAARLESLAVELFQAIRAVYSGATVWTSHDGTRSFRIPRRMFSLVDYHSPQHYPADEGLVVSQKTLNNRIQWSRGQWDALAENNVTPSAVSPYGSKWIPYFQGHGHSTGALVWGLCEAQLARLWAFPNSWSEQAVPAMVMARKLRAVCGFGPDAVERWQARKGLSMDGVVGPATLGSLASA